PAATASIRLEPNSQTTTRGSALPPAATFSKVVTASTAKASPSEASTSIVTRTSRRKLTCCSTGRMIELLTQPNTAPTIKESSQEKSRLRRQTAATAVE